MARRKKADDYNYQTRALEFQVGQTVALVLGGPTDVGRVVEIYPAIGMAEVQWPNTVYRHPVEDLQIVNEGDSPYIAPRYQTVPGGAGTVSVSAGPPADDIPIQGVKPLVENVQIVKNGALIEKVAKVFVKKALYWNGVNRQYRGTKLEVGTNKFLCPKKCCDGTLRNAVYKRMDGKSVRLMACPECLFLIRRDDILDGSMDSSCEEEIEGEII